MTYSHFMQGLIHFLITTIFIMLVNIGWDYIEPVILCIVATGLCFIINLAIFNSYDANRNKHEGGNATDPRR